MNIYMYICFKGGYFWLQVDKTEEEYPKVWITKIRKREKEKEGEDLE